MSVSLRSALRDTLGLAVRRRSAARTWRVVQRAAHRPHVANLRDVHHDWHEDGGEAIIAMKTPAIENAVLPTFPWMTPTISLGAALLLVWRPCSSSSCRSSAA